MKAKDEFAALRAEMKQVDAKAKEAERAAAIARESQQHLRDHQNELKNLLGVGNGSWPSIRTAMTCPELVGPKMAGGMVAIALMSFVIPSVFSGMFLVIPFFLFLFFLGLFAFVLYRAVKLVRNSNRWAAFQNDWLRWGP